MPECISWNKPSFGQREFDLVNDTLTNGYVSEGPMTMALEEKLAKIVGTKYVIMTTNATAALYLAIEADKRIRQYNSGEVIIPGLTFVATKNAVEMAGLKYKCQDVDDASFMLSPTIPSTETKIIIPVNLLGRNIDIKNEDVTVIYDNAGCLGSKVDNGKVGCYSLQANKIINCGQGGFCATDDELYANEIRKIKDFGRDNKDQNRTTGFNFKFNDILAAVAYGQLDLLENRKILHKDQYTKYKKELSDCGYFIEFDLENGEIPLWIEFITDKRDELYDYLLTKNINCRKPWQSISVNCPNAVRYSRKCLWLPNGSCLTEEQQNIVIQEIKNFYGRN